ncbi:hypothetical protein GCM10022297_15710 [Lactobacillus hamsteri]|uniref:Uncharacterized protein n=1 Tax=Lactobacillus hamsteri DSM 5661 = JCM 6256 TaxID=1423754 RepID=A0A0R1YIK8_9LACO|nr:hypothetical protein [Lactobacillus hamsteri]KRM40740.1 hypothetical protein FC39_GL000224 [Lactobacillus hamsteri DSM 5661 = JCM 6256]
MDDEKSIDSTLPALVFVPHKNYFLSMQKHLRKVNENPQLKVYDTYFDKINSYAVQHIDLSDFFYIKERKYSDLKRSLKRKPSKLIQELNTTIRELWFKENRKKGLLVSTFSDHKVGFIMLNKNFKTKKEIIVSGKCDGKGWHEYDNRQLRQDPVFEQKEKEIRNLYKDRKSVNNEMIIFDLENPEKFAILTRTPLRVLPSAEATKFKLNLFDKNVEKTKVKSFLKAVDESPIINLQLISNALDMIDMSSKMKYSLNDIYLMVRSKGSDPQKVFNDVEGKLNKCLPKGNGLKEFNKLCHKYFGQNIFMSKSKDSGFGENYAGFLDLNYAIFLNNNHTKLLFSAGVIEKNFQQSFSKNPVIYQFEGSEEICEIIKDNLSELLSGFIRFHQTSVTFFPKKYLSQKIDEIIYTKKQYENQQLLKTNQLIRIEDLQDDE